MAENADSPEIVCKYGKIFMGWKSTGTPHQLKVNNQLITSAKNIAQSMNEFLLQKVQKIHSLLPFQLIKLGK